MQHAARNRATVGVADRTGFSGRVTASSINDGSRAKRQGSPWRIYGSRTFASLVLIVVSTSLGPMSAHADPGGVPVEIADLQQQVAALQSQVQALQNQVNTQEQQITTLQSQGSSLQTTWSQP